MTSPFIKFLEDYRVLLMTICLPVSYAYGCYTTFRKSLQFLLQSFLGKTSTHEDRVRAISEALQRRKTAFDGQGCKETDRERPDERKIPLITTDRPVSDALQLSFLDKSRMFQVQTSRLSNILSLNEKDLTVTVEPMVSVQAAVDYLLPKGYMLASHLEYGRATLGGLAMAVGMTTHAHHTGLLQETVISYEVVLSDGKIITVKEDNEYSDLFHCLPWSHGTLGILTSLELKIIRVKKYVKLRYIPVKGGGVKKICEKIRQYCGALDPKQKNVPTFCEATLYDLDRAVIQVADFCDGNESPDIQKLNVNPLSLWWRPWWFKYCETFLKEGDTRLVEKPCRVGKQEDPVGKQEELCYEELVPVGDYILRHTRSIFWVMELMVPYGNNCLFRWFFGWLLPLDTTFMKMTTTSGVRKLQIQKQIFQDITLPMTDLERSINLSAEVFDLWPILIYPCKEFSIGKGQLRAPRKHQICPGTGAGSSGDFRGGASSNQRSWGMFFDIGIYGVPGYVLRKEPFNPTKAMRKYIEFVMEVGGHPFLYADHWFDESEFEKLFDLTNWRQCRKKYEGDGHFPSIWEKVKSEVDVMAIGNIDLYSENQKKNI